MEPRIKTNNKPRELIHGIDLTEKERKDFDYMTEEELLSASFIRYRGRCYDLGEFTRNSSRLPADNPLSSWDGYLGDSFFSGVVIRFIGEDCEQVIMGTYLS